MSSSCSSYSSSSSSSSPCGACKFLRRKCVKGCVFAPYFSHEQGATHFGAIHKVFGASNVSKLLSHLPIADRCEAAVTIAYEAQARVHDPIYGCVSHIFALQQQVMYLQAQLASLKEQAAAAAQNPNNIFNPAVEPMQDVVQSGRFPQNDHQGTNMPPFDANLIGNVMMNMSSTCFANDELNPSTVKYEDPGIQEENSVGNMDSSNYRQWEFGVGDDDDHADDLQSVALRYIRRNS